MVRSDDAPGPAAVIGLLVLSGCLAPNPGWDADDQGGSSDATGLVEQETEATAQGATDGDDTGAGTNADTEPTGDSTDVYGQCFGDDFDNEMLGDVMWNQWIDPGSDAELTEVGGTLNLTPASGRVDSLVVGTGVITDYLHQFAFGRGFARLEVVAPPQAERPVSLFLQVRGEADSILSLQLRSDGSVDVSGSAAATVKFSETFSIETPGWIGIRADGSDVHFEMSSDGLGWTTFATFEKPATFATSALLIMVLTVDDNPQPQTIAVDNVEVCFD